MITSSNASDQSLTEDAIAQGRIIEGNLDPWGQMLVRHYAELKPRFAHIKTFSQLHREVQTLADRSDWEYYCNLKRYFEPPQQKAKNGRPKGAWELTLTYSPKWYQDDHEAQNAFKKAEQRLLKYYADELQQYRSVGEYTKDGRAHLHILYRLDGGGKFTDKNLRRAYPHWNAKVKVGKGCQGGHHAPCNSVSDYAGYIEKDLHTAWHQYDITSHAEEEPDPSPTPAHEQTQNRTRRRETTCSYDEEGSGFDREDRDGPEA